MSSSFNVLLSVSLTPYDAFILVTIYTYCLRDIDVPLEVFQELISPTLECNDYNPLIDPNIIYNGINSPLIPDLRYIVRRLETLDVSENTIASILQLATSIETLEMIYTLLKRINAECLVKTSKELRSLSKAVLDEKKKFITENSLLGQYVIKCLLKVEIGGFEDKNLLLHCFKSFIGSFVNSELHAKYSTIQNQQHLNLNMSLLKTPRTADDTKMIALFQTYTDRLKRDEPPDLIISTSHLENIFDWYLFKLVNDSASDIDEEVSDLVEVIIEHITLHNQTMLPKVLIIRYFQHIHTNSYEGALDTLHNYFDYVLSQNVDSSFHISLLCLAAFHIHFHEPDMAVRCFEEAIKVAREQRDTTTLNLIIVWTIKFLEDNPEYSKEFHVKIEQITKFLKSNNDNVDSSIFENAYRFDSLFHLRMNDDMVALLESSYKYFAISLQSLKSDTGLSAALEFRAQLWNELGFSSIADVYSKHTDVTETEHLLNDGNSKLATGDIENFQSLLDSLDCQDLSYDESIRLNRMKIKFLAETNQIDSALDIVERLIKKTAYTCLDIRSSAEFQMERVILFSKAGIGLRGIADLQKLIEYYSSISHGFRRAKCLLSIMNILLEEGRLQNIESMLTKQLAEIMQYPELRPTVTSVVASMEKRV